MRSFLVAYSDYEQQTHITDQDGGDLALARNRELVYSVTQMIVVDEFRDGKPWVDLSEEDLMQELKTLVGVGVLQKKTILSIVTAHLLRKMDANVPRLIAGFSCKNVPCGDTSMVDSTR